MPFTRGTRCRITRPIVSPGRMVERGTPGTVVWWCENLGRQLVTVQLERRGRVVLFAHEIEVVSDEFSQSSS